MSVKYKLLIKFTDKKDPILKEHIHIECKDLLFTLIKNSKQAYYKILKQIGMILKTNEKNQIRNFSKSFSFQCNYYAFPL